MLVVLVLASAFTFVHVQLFASYCAEQACYSVEPSQLLNLRTANIACCSGMFNSSFEYTYQRGFCVICSSSDICYVWVSVQCHLNIASDYNCKLALRERLLFSGALNPQP